MGYLNQILLRANQGMAFYVDTESNTVRKMVEARRIEASYNIDINSYQELGNQTIQHYPGSIEIRGTMELYICSTYFIKKIEEYRKGGATFTFDLQIQNGIMEDQSSYNRNIGYQDITLQNILLSRVPITALGLDSSASSGSFEFVADGLVVNQSFNNYLEEIGGV